MENSEIIKNQFAWLQKLQVISKKPILIKAIEGAKPEGADIDLYAWIEFSSIWAKVNVPIYTRSILQSELCFDPDLKDWQMLQMQFNKIVEYCRGEGIPLTLAYSGGNGVHGHVFFDSFAIDTDNFENAKKYDIDLFKIVRTVLCDLILKGAGVTAESIRLDSKKIRFSAFRNGSMVREFGTNRADGNFKTLITEIPDQKPKPGSLPLIFPENIYLWKIPEKWNTEINEAIRKEIEKSISRNQLNFDGLSLSCNTLEKFPCIKHLMKNGSKQRYYAAVSITLMGKQCGATWKIIEAAIKKCYSQSDITEAEAELRINNVKNLYTSDHHFSCRELKEIFGADICDFSKCVIHEKVLKIAAEAEKKQEQEVAPDNIKQKAKEIMETGDPLTYLLDTQQKIHIGDRDNAEFLFITIGVQSCRNSTGLHPKGSGNSGMGKTHCAKAVLHLVPPKYKFHGSSSEKYFYYEKLNPGTVILLDDTTLSEGMEGVIKRSTSNFQEGDFHRTLDANRNPVSLYIPPRVSWWLTSVNDSQSLQVLNRQILIEPDETEAQDKEVCKHQQHMAEEGLIAFPENEDVLICREIIRELKEQLYIVKIPYATAISWYDIANRRSLDIFFDMIKGLCILRHKQRFTDESGALIANLDDYREALRLFSLRAKTQKTKLNRSELVVLQAILDAPEGIDANDLQIVTGVTKVRLSQILNGEKGRTGLLEKVRGLTQEKVSITDTGTGKTIKKTYYKTTGFSRIEEYNNVAELDNKKLSTAPIKSTKLLNLWQQAANPENLTWLNWLNWSVAYRPDGITPVNRQEKYNEQDNNIKDQKQSEAYRKEDETSINEPIKPVKSELSTSYANEKKEEINTNNNNNGYKLSQLSLKEKERAEQNNKGSQQELINMIRGKIKDLSRTFPEGLPDHILFKSLEETGADIGRISEVIQHLIQHGSIVLSSVKGSQCYAWAEA